MRTNQRKTYLHFKEDKVFNEVHKVTNHILLILLCLLLSFVACASIQKDWAKATKINTVISYKEFLAQHPQTEFSQIAKSRIEEIEFKQLEHNNSIQAYENFIHDYPESMYTEKVRKRIAAHNSLIANYEKVSKEFEEFVQKMNEGGTETELLFCPEQYRNVYQIIPNLGLRGGPTLTEKCYDGYWIKIGKSTIVLASLIPKPSPDRISDHTAFMRIGTQYLFTRENAEKEECEKDIEWKGEIISNKSIHYYLYINGEWVENETTSEDGGLPALCKPCEDMTRSPFPPDPFSRKVSPTDQGIFVHPPPSGW